MIQEIHWIDWLPNKKRIAAQNTAINCKPENKNYHQYINSTELPKSVHKLKQTIADHDLSWNILLKEIKYSQAKIHADFVLKKHF